MKKSLYVFLFFGLRIVAQNLCPNPSFESFTACPISIGIPCPWMNQGSYDHVNFWKNPICTSPDIFCSCYNSGGAWPCDVPANFAGYQAARTDSSYAGLWTGLPTTQNAPHFGEYICTPLLAPLLAGNAYVVTFYVSCGKFNYNQGTNAIGAYLSIGYPDTTGSEQNFRLFNTAQVLNAVNNQITDTINWLPISGTFTALGGENFLTIGTFLPDSLIAGDGAYLYVDDVSIALASIDHLLNYDQPIIKVSPNPVSDKLQVSSSSPIKEIKFCSVSGVELQEQVHLYFTSPYDSSLDLLTIESGIYLLSIKTENNQTVRRRIVRE